MKHTTRSRAISRGGAALLVSLAMVSCGSTVQIRTAPGQDGLGGLAPADQGLTGGSNGEPRSSTAGPQPAGSAGGSPTGVEPGVGLRRNGSPRTPGSTTATPTPDRAASSEPIRLGVITQPGLEQAAKTVGLDGVTTGDTRKQVEAVLAWIRVNGGLGGHPVQLYEYQAEATNTAWQSEACASMTQDHKVRFVLTVLGNLKVLADCLAKAGVGLLADNTNLGDKAMRTYAPILGNPSEMSPGRTMSTLVDALVSKGWLTKQSVIGVLADDGTDGHDTVEGPLTEALARHGLKAAITRYINPNTGDGGSSQSGSGVVGFRAAGVDRVIPVMYSPLYMMIAAESQQYYPAYALTSALAPGALLEASAPANQLKNAAGIGWAPFLDIGKGPAAPPVSARATLCFDLMRKGGQAATSALVKGFQAQVCDLLMYFKDLAALRPTIPADLMTSGRIALGKGFVSPATYRVDITNRTDGVAGTRPLAYLDTCSCFQYTGPVTTTQ